MKGLDWQFASAIFPVGLIDWLDFAFVNISPITDSENKNICAHKGINYPIVTNTILA